MLKKIAIGADHAGYCLKEALKEHLKKQQYDVTDVGCINTERCDYPDFSAKVAESVQQSSHDAGVLICGSGIGMAMTANRYPGIRAVVVTDHFSATMSRKHNNANVICLGARVTAEPYAAELVDLFLNTEFEGGRHQDRVNKIDSVKQGEALPCKG